MTFDSFLNNLGLQKNQHLLVHSSYRAIRSVFPDLMIKNLIKNLQERVTPVGSIIMPAFTYCFKKSIGDYESFDPKNSLSKVGAVSEVFRNMPDVIRTSSPTHSFSLWGKASQEVDKTNSPTSPLGQGSMMAWLNNQDDAYILLLGVDFSAMSFCHFLEVETPVPWIDYSPWDHLHVEKIGISIDGEQRLKEIPGCSQSFINFEKYLTDKKFIKPFKHKKLTGYYLPVQIIYEAGIQYFRNHFQNLLCPAGTCQACDARRQFYLEKTA